MQYKTITGHPKDFGAAVVPELKEGWRLHGGPMVYTVNSVVKMVQALVRDNPDAEVDAAPGEYEARLDDLDNIVEVQCIDGTWNWDPYLHGMANGLILAQATMRGEAPKYLPPPEKWLREENDQGKEVDHGNQEEVPCEGTVQEEQE